MIVILFKKNGISDFCRDGYKKGISPKLAIRRGTHSHSTDAERCGGEPLGKFGVWGVFFHNVY